MGRSASCFKRMACGGSDPNKDNDDEMDGSEVKSARHRWSFQKRSARHRVLNNSVLSESLAENKEISECIDANTKAMTDFDAVEKVSAIPCAVEKPQLSAPSEVISPEIVIETKPDIIEQKAAIVIIQAAIRAYLAQKKLQRLRNVIKMQALVRGHLVRRHAVGTLRCVHAIVKMQALVRTRYANRLGEGSSIIDENTEKKAMGTETVKNKVNATHIAIERLLGNRFAQQLLESRPKTKPIHIKCDTSKTHSSWLWVERWMSASSSKQSPSMEASNEEQISEVNKDIVSHRDTTLTPEVVHFQTTLSQGETDTMAGDGGSDAPSMEASNEEEISEVNEDIVSHGDTTFTSEIVPFETTSSHGETDTMAGDGGSDILTFVLKDSEIEETPDVDESTVFLEIVKEIVSNEISNPEPETLSIGIISEGDIEQPKHSGKRVAQEQLMTDSRKSGPQRVSNPEFTAALSKFEEMTSGTMSSGPVVSSSAPAETRSKDNSVSDNMLAELEEQLVTDSRKSVPQRVSNPEFTASLSKFEEMTSSAMSSGSVISSSAPAETRSKDNSVSDNMLAELGGSESQTELSISSTLDSPDRNGYVENENQMQIPDDEAFRTDSVEYHEDKVLSDHTDERADSMSKVDNAIVVAEEVDPSRQEIGKPMPDLDAEVTAEATPHPKASPISPMIISESQGTPASPASANNEVNRSEKSILSHKRKSLSAGKRSPTNPNQESSSSNSKEFPRDRMTTRRRSMKLEDTEQEPRDSTSSIPRFMQTTESARAKLNANSSPRSSPGVLDMDVRQGSPRIRQHGGKSNRTQVQERKWIR